MKHDVKLSNEMINFLEKNIYQDDVFYDKIENEFSKLVSDYNNQKINLKEMVKKFKKEENIVKPTSGKLDDLVEYELNLFNFIIKDKENKKVELLNQLKSKIEVVRGNVNNVIDDKKSNLIVNGDKLKNLSFMQHIFKSKDLREESNIIKYRLENLEKIKESILRTDLVIDKINIINNSQLSANQITKIKQEIILSHTVSKLGKTNFIKEDDFLKIFDDNQSEVLDKTIKDFKTILSKGYYDERKQFTTFDKIKDNIIYMECNSRNISATFIKSAEIIKKSLLNFTPTGFKKLCDKMIGESRIIPAIAILAVCSTIISVVGNSTVQNIKDNNQQISEISKNYNNVMDLVDLKKQFSSSFQFGLIGDIIDNLNSIVLNNNDVSSKDISNVIIHQTLPLSMNIDEISSKINFDIPEIIVKNKNISLNNKKNHYLDIV